ncbi:unnamed protein product [Oreochromis niloticus]|nr:unnamed protein product [Mustela putorius furo]
MYLNREEDNSKGSVSLSVFLVSLAVTVCAVWLVALCGVCGWCQRKLGKRNKPGVETADTPDSARGRGEKKAINSKNNPLLQTEPCIVSKTRSGCWEWLVGAKAVHSCVALTCLSLWPQ